MKLLHKVGPKAGGGELQVLVWRRVLVCVWMCHWALGPGALLSLPFSNPKLPPSDGNTATLGEKYDGVRLPTYPTSVWKNQSTTAIPRTEESIRCSRVNSNLSNLQQRTLGDDNNVADRALGAGGIPGRGRGGLAHTTVAAHHPLSPSPHVPETQVANLALL